MCLRSSSFRSESLSEADRAPISNRGASSTAERRVLALLLKLPSNPLLPHHVGSIPLASAYPRYGQISDRPTVMFQ
jgi:hypothetical protein